MDELQDIPSCFIQKIHLERSDESGVDTKNDLGLH